MDVIALGEAGLTASVAPLGTAITEDQLRLLWRIHDEPVIALDGDTAGLRAAMRAIDLALPLLEAGKSLRFCMMPEGLDPDDLIRAEGSAAMRKLVAEAVPMVQLLWRRETEGKVFDSPERRAALDLSLQRAVQGIGDPSIKRHYGEELNRLRRSLFDGGENYRTGRRARGTWSRSRGAPALPTVEAKASVLAVQGSAVEERLREAVILATLAARPNLVSEFIADLESLETREPDHAAVRDALLRLQNESSEQVDSICDASALEKVRAPAHVRIAPGVREGASEDVARMSIAEEFAKLAARRGAEREIAEAMEDVEGLVDEGLTWRLSQAAEAKAAAERSGSEDRSEYDTGPNGARIKRTEKSAFASLLDRIDFSKGGGRGA